jgi:hypothetical protein
MNGKKEEPLVIGKPCLPDYKPPPEYKPPSGIAYIFLGNENISHP